MGAPKQKWTPEEEAALKAGIAKHGSGRWRTILKDPEFSDVLSLRSNVDLKDKWRNMCVIPGSGSRERGRVQKKFEPVVKQEEKPLALTVVVQSDEGLSDAKTPNTTSGIPRISGTASSNKSSLRLGNLVLEAITTLKEPRGSDKTDISMYIEDHFDIPPDFNRILSEKLKGLTESGVLIKVNRKYRIAPSAAFSEVIKNTRVHLPDGRQMNSPSIEKVNVRTLTPSQVDAELESLRGMTAQEAAAAAARAVAEAEAALEEAERASREAEAAEADANEAQAFAEAAKMTFEKWSMPNMMVHL